MFVKMKYNIFVVIDLRGVPHAHIVAFLHDDDKLRMNVDWIDQMIWSEIPIDFDSKDFKDYLKEYRNADKDRPRRFREFHLDGKNGVHENVQDDVGLEQTQNRKGGIIESVSMEHEGEQSEDDESMTQLLDFFNIDNDEEPSMNNEKDVFEFSDNFIFISCVEENDLVNKVIL